MGLGRHDFKPAELADQIAAEREGQAFLVYRDRDGTQAILALSGERMTVGRDPGADLALDWDPGVSRLHSLLEFLAGSWTVVDEGLSRNGTFVNEVRLRGRRRLSDRDMLRFGATQALFRSPGTPLDETPAMATGKTGQVTEAQHRVLVALCRPLFDDPAGHNVPPSNAQIAEQLTLGVESVRTHLKTLFKLFEIPDLPQSQKRAELARRALASGIVAPRDLSD